jgi:hypothetical protein
MSEHELAAPEQERQSPTWEALNSAIEEFSRAQHQTIIEAASAELQETKGDTAATQDIIESASVSIERSSHPEVRVEAAKYGITGATEPEVHIERNNEGGIVIDLGNGEWQTIPAPTEELDQAA